VFNPNNLTYDIKVNFTKRILSPSTFKPSEAAEALIITDVCEDIKRNMVYNGDNMYYIKIFVTSQLRRHVCNLINAGILFEIGDDLMIDRNYFFNTMLGIKDE